LLSQYKILSKSQLIEIGVGSKTKAKIKERFGVETKIKKKWLQNVNQNNNNKKD
jgi:hypothetical protein